MSNNDRELCASGMRELVTWATRVREPDIPRRVMQRAALVLADDLAAMIAARSEAEVIAFHDWVLARTAQREATVFRGARQKTDRFWAAVANGVAADWLELDEGYRKTSCHAGLYALPALLAEAEARNTPVAEVLRILTLAYEIVTRIARAWTAPDISMHVHARYAAIGAAAAASLIRESDAETTLAAVTAACTLISPGPRDHAVKGALIRNAWPAVGAWNGLMCAEWASCGIGGVPESPHDVFGVVLGGKLRASQLTDRLGDEWAVLDGYTKIHACCQQTHSAAEAVLELGLHGSARGLADIQEIVVETHPLAMPLKNYEPQTTLASKFSLPHVIATAFAHGHAGAQAFSASALTDETVSRLRNKVQMIAFDPLPAAPNDRPARIRVRMNDGRELVSECLSARGGPDRPFPEEVLVEKVRELSAPAYPKLLPLMLKIAALEPSSLARGWRDTVDVFAE